MQRSLWSKARENRPTIYAPKQKPLIERYADGSGEGRSCSVTEFNAFLNDFFGNLKSCSSDVYEKHAQISKALAGLDFPMNYHIRNRNGSQAPFCFTLGWALFMRDYYEEQKFDEPERFVSTSISVNPASYYNGVIKQFTESYVYYMSIFRELYGTMPMNLFRDSREMEMWEHVFRTHKRDCVPETEEFRSLLKTFLESARNMIITEHQFTDNALELLFILNPPTVNIAVFQMEYFPFTYKWEMSRLYAVVGENTDEIYVPEFHPYTVSHNISTLQDRKPCGYLDEIDLYGEHYVLINMYPWEADHIEKAREIQRRGISVAEPIGKVFMGEYEFAVFQWVHGDVLSSNLDSDVWKKYGQVVRKCFENGINLEDAAGRNAVWTGEKITLIDFEHTRLNQENKPISQEERNYVLQKIEAELYNYPEVFSAFMSGYENSH